MDNLKKLHNNSIPEYLCLCHSDKTGLCYVTYFYIGFGTCQGGDGLGFFIFAI